MTNAPNIPPRPSPFLTRVSAEDERLQARLTAIRAGHQAGRLTHREAADETIAALEAHLDRCRQLRREWLGE